MMKKYLLNFCRSTQPGFRSAEMNGLAKLFGISYEQNLFDEIKPHAVVEFENDEPIKKLLFRSVLLKTASELLVVASSYSEFYDSVRKCQKLIESCTHDSSTFSFWIDSTGKKLDQKYKIAKIEELSFLSIKGTVKLDQPDVTFYILEYYGCDAVNVPENPLEIFFGVLIGKGQRTVPGLYTLKTRTCIGNTSMDPLLSFIATNIAAVAPNAVVFDPFVGTGSLLLPAAHFGAYCLGCDINYNLLHGAGKSSRQGVKYRCKNETIHSNFDQYGLSDRYVDILIADSSRTELWRTTNGPLFDAIVTDPPYGIRETSIKVGTKINRYPDVEPLSQSHPIRYPSKVKYSFIQVFLDLLNFAAVALTMSGRLVYWFPIIYKEMFGNLIPGFMTVENTFPGSRRLEIYRIIWTSYFSYDNDVVPQHPCLQLITTSEQKLSSSHGRLLICMEKIKDPLPSDCAFVLRNDFEKNTLRDFVFTKGLQNSTDKFDE